MRGKRSSEAGPEEGQWLEVTGVAGARAHAAGSRMASPELPGLIFSDQMH